MEQEPEQQEASPVETVEVNENKADDPLKDHKTFAILGYIIPILFFLPLLDEKSKSNAFAKFHANQQIIILIMFVALHFLATFMLMPLGGLGVFIHKILSLALIVLAIYGAFHSYKGGMKQLPFVGHFRILK